MASTVSLQFPLLSLLLLVQTCTISATRTTVQLLDGVTMPVISLGTCCGSKPEVGVPPWIQSGGVGIDTAFDYRDQQIIGEVLSRMNISRKDVFITTKIPAGVGNASDCRADPDLALAYVREDLRQLKLDYVDLVLLHAPCGIRHKVKDASASNNALWKGLEKAKQLGLTRSIGVSNYRVGDLMALEGEVPTVNQCRMGVEAVKSSLGNGWAHDEETIRYCKKKKIAYQAWRVIGGCPMKHETLQALAKKYQKTPAQICMKWVVQRGCILAVGTGADPIKAARHAKENLDIFDWELTSDEIVALNKINPSQPKQQAQSVDTIAALK